MKKIKNVIFAVLIAIFGIFNVQNASAATSEYTISDYKISMVVNENNTFDITEEITADFHVPKHGIFRTLPLYNEVKRADGTSSKNRVKISDVKVSGPFTKSTENGKMKLKIGDEDRTLTGENTYVIQYNYNIGKDPLEDKDELYFNLLGNDWDTNIENFSFEIKMPKEFDKEKLGFSSGAYGKVGNDDDVFYWVSGNTIKGMHVGTLKAGESVTVRLELPEGYFVGAGIEISPIYYVFYAVPIAGALIAAYFWVKYGKDRKTFIKPEYFPPKDANSLEVGFFYKGNVGSKDVISLLIYLANKGYLTISDNDEKGLLGKKKGFVLHKVKEYDGKNENEKLFFKGLFESGDEVTSKDLYDKFYKTTTKIISNQNSKENKNKIFEKNGARTAILFLIAIVSFVLITIPPFIDYADYEDMVMALLFPGIGLMVMLAGFASWKTTGKGVLVFLLFWGVLFAGIPAAMILLPALLIDPVYLIGFLVGFVGVVVTMVFIYLMPKRTEYGMEKYAEVKGFKDFLTSVEKDRIEQMVEEYPNYFYDILPFTYVLGISDKWIKKFESINLQAPDWYRSSTAFNMSTFNSFMNSTMASATSSMSSSSSSSSSGGGGFSGGGSGGGGGGSW
ncbi:DUF2207 domain-containing protein [Candidatus Saccharibacteria bacterium]|nr:DUF2207 domain-containing protein [Candidatus Saccharibacteria bacterium]